VDRLNQRDIKGKVALLTDSSCLENTSNDCLFLIDLVFDFFEGKKI